MEDNKTSDGISRRALLGGTALGVAGASKMVLAESDPDNLAAECAGMDTLSGVRRRC